ncbi:uncharacterized protein LOC119085910 isoform X1 [Bradysia coprophila]|uniref:uncharacterized protein LOC119085910 isoform X1 n=1 Tax=Bradysia coprophila TaxID=38358 RepID=UPI00187D9829|nr:uncharacterized protein LOC119085910 isoform X1 [Bradysia coprophila]XP_037052351.1 uncharacterized protein LOC119085910 isoform X1 [Bradysia coprophila]XP_037052352.1 uncharacterized protein LOC119085910 isoform X1 [Bradysia coprophila]
MDAPSMVHRSGDTLIVRSVVSGDQLYLDNNEQGVNKLLPFHHNSFNNNNDNESNGDVDDSNLDNTSNLPQCKIKRNYSCNNCTFFTQNPRHFLNHLKDVHGEKIIINECKYCLYASKHYQKLVRHMKMVHGSTDGLEEQAQSRKRASQLAREQKKRKSSLEDIHLNQQPLSLIQQQTQPLFVNQLLAEPSSSPDYTNNKLLKCTVCDYSTLHREKLTEHEREEHNKTKFFRCEKCSYVTHIKARFSKHVKYHSMPMIKCVLCDFRTPYKWNLDRHMKNHGGAGLYKCSACNFTADIKQSLTVHEMNHHVPPVGHASGMSMARRRNKVGGTDIVEQYSPMNLSDSSVGVASGIDFSTNNNNNNSSLNSYNEPMAKKIRMEEHEQQWYQSMAADLSQRPHTETVSSQKKPARPVPNLIPIQPAIVSPTAMNLSITPRSFHDNTPATITKNERTLNDLAMLLSGADAMNLQASEHMIANSKRIFRELMALSHQNEGLVINPENVVSPPQLSPTSSNASSVAKRKTVNFFEELKEKFIAANGGSLTCRCGHSSKCLSELLIHQKMCSKYSQSPVNLSTGSSSGSTRCQFCRQRCKSSTDLMVHMQHCMEARSNADSMESISSDYGSTDKVDGCDDIMDESCDEENENDGEPHPMEHKVFVWNKMPERRENDNDIGDDDRDDNNDDAHNEDSETTEDGRTEKSKYFAVETAPGYGEVTKKMNPDDEPASGSLKKVFKCPHCTFWASTASRFHVHIVGHLNKKPFECSLCSYRSNWRWDITKHIRLKTIRDPSHKTAKVLMNDETGRRNYTKYNKHITLMKVDAEDGDPKLLKSGEMTPSQEANLSFLQKSESNIPQKAKANEVIDLDNEIPLSLVKPVVSFDLTGRSTSSSAVTVGEEEQDLNKQAKANKNDSKVTSFKCKKCNFRDANRDVVLNHVKGHYQEAGIKFEDKNVPAAELSQQIISQPNPSPPIAAASPIPTPSSSQTSKLYSKLLSAAMGFPNLNVPPQLHPTALKSLQLHNQDLHSAPLNLQKPVTPQPPQLVPADMSTATSSSSSSSTTALSAAAAVVVSETAQPTIEHGETDEASSLGTSVTGWRDPAPYRCGHCHQMSNWKHVIQRHCRLKHNGDINIEVIEKRNSNKRTYVRLNCPSSSGQRSSHHDMTESGSEDVMEHHAISQSPSVSQQLSSTNNAEQFNQLAGNYSTENATESPKNMETDHDDAKSLPNQSNPPNQLIQLLNKKPKRYQCPSCPYVSPCRSQLESHHKFHNQNECSTFQCRHCSYNVTKKHLLYQHQKMHEYEKVGRDETNEDSSASEAIDLTSSLPKSSDGQHEKQLMFCSYCPARYLNEKELKGHTKMHASFFPYRCAICTYTSRQESYIETHLNVHTSSYQQKTKLMLNEFDIKSDCPQPRLSTIPTEHNDDNVFWIVSEYNPKPRPNAGSSNNDMDLDDMISASKVPNKTFASPPKIPPVHDSPCKPSTSIDSIASPPPPTTHKTILLQSQGLQNRESKQNKIVISKPEKCPHCPFCTTKPDVLKEHMQCHVTVSGTQNPNNCDHCDYSVSDELVLKEHIKLHFCASSLSPTLISNRKSVAFFTCYDGLTLSGKMDSDVDGHESRTIYPIADDQEMESVSDKENKKIIVDINTGEEMK